jgi:hypothetical protein
MKKKELIAEIENLTNIIEERNAYIRKDKEDKKWKLIDEFKDNVLKIGGSNVNVTMEMSRGHESIKRHFKLEFEL